jgi:hypothetical protein
MKIFSVFWSLKKRQLKNKKIQGPQISMDRKHFEKAIQLERWPFHIEKKRYLKRHSPKPGAQRIETDDNNGSENHWILSRGHSCPPEANNSCAAGFQSFCESLTFSQVPESRRAASKKLSHLDLV